MLKYVAGCLVMATAHDEAGRRVPLAQCGSLSNLTQNMLTRGKVGSTKEESKRGAASERTPLSSATPALGVIG